jgi:hypothetical protein
MSVVIVAGALANKPHNGGGTWERMSWVTGLRRLGCEVFFVEQIERATPANVEWFRSVTEWFGVADHAALVCGDDAHCAGLSRQRLLEVAGRADILVNLSGHLTLPPLLERLHRKAYVDVDPGFTQFWHTDASTGFALGGHDFYYTIGENIGAADCPIPTAGLQWRHIRQPVVLDDWPAAGAGRPGRFTTIASWRGAFGPVSCGGRTYGLKVHEFRKVLPLPRRVPAATFEIALDIQPADLNDLSALRGHGWYIREPGVVAGDPAAFRRYVQESAAEFSVAQGIYAETNSGWFSDRTVRYLASGKPALVQDTGFGRHLPVGAGLLAFRTLDEAAAGAEEVLSNYEWHCRAARDVAAAYFDSDKVLAQFLDEVGVGYRTNRTRGR